MVTNECKKEEFLINYRKNRDGNYVMEAFTYNFKGLVDNFAVKAIICYIISLFMMVTNSMPSAIHIIVALGFLDLFTGLCKAVKNKKIDFIKSFYGFIKIFLYLLAVSVGVLLDMFFLADKDIYAASYLISAFIIVNLAISVLENLYILGVPIPEKFIKFLKNCSRDIDDSCQVISFPKK